MKISTSILSIENDKIKIDKVINSTTDCIHLDIMDGKFVSSKTIDDDLIISYLKKCQKPIDIHFMTYNVKEYVKKYVVLKPSYIIFHYETGENILDIIKYIKSRNIKAGIAINPKTDVNLIKDILPYIDLVLIMSVEPGRGGQEFMLSSINKINELVELKEKYNFLIEIDGGINDKTISYLNGVDIAVCGSYITNSDNYNEKIIYLKSQVKI